MPATTFASQESLASGTAWAITRPQRLGNRLAGGGHVGCGTTRAFWYSVVPLTQYGTTRILWFRSSVEKLLFALAQRACAEFFHGLQAVIETRRNQNQTRSDCFLETSAVRKHRKEQTCRYVCSDDSISTLQAIMIIGGFLPFRRGCKSRTDEEDGLHGTFDDWKSRRSMWLSTIIVQEADALLRQATPKLSRHILSEFRIGRVLSSVEQRSPIMPSEYLDSV